MSEHMSCSDALEQLWAFLDDELCAEDTARVQEHLDRCRVCYPHYDFDSAYRQLVALHCRQPAPPGVRRKIFMALLEESAAGS
jgi:mycothiol system anti-sigma-R factor